MPAPYVTLDACRVCGSARLVPYLDLGAMPLVNRYVVPASAPARDERFPLEIQFCPVCANSQLSIVVDPAVLYSSYDYHSSVSETFRRHCEELAARVVADLGLRPGQLVTEIASNDGCMLNEFKPHGVKLLGVEPASNLARLANERGLPTLNRFWSLDVAQEIRSEHGPASLLLGTNVVAHVHDLHGFFAAARHLVEPAGAFVFEVPYLVNFINRAEFDTTYHEHLSYFLLKPLKLALERNGLTVVDAEQFEIHGGSIRVTARPAEHAGAVSERVASYLKLEEDLGLHETPAYERFARQVQVIREELVAFLAALKGRGKRIAGFGASAKGNVLLNYCGLGAETFEYVVDDTPAKQGKLYPGNRLPIVGRDRLASDPPDYLLILAWNFADEIVAKTAEFQRQGGRYLVPIPSLRVM